MATGPGSIPERIPVPQVTPPPRPASPKADFKPADRPELELAPDKVTFSPRAREASSISVKAKAVPEVRQERVQDVRTRIENSGNSAANGAKIAEKLLTEN